MATDKGTVKHDLLDALDRAMRTGLTAEDIGAVVADFLYRSGQGKKQKPEPAKTAQTLPPGALNRRNSD